LYGNGLSNKFANIEVSRPTTKKEDNRKTRFLLVTKKTKGKMYKDTDYDALERNVHLAQDVSGSCYDARLSWNSNRARVSAK